MARANLKDLPEELVSNISLRLWSDDVQALRLTCKALESKTLHEWATEYFSEKGFIISSDSLKVLLSIANSSKLRPYLRHIHILTAHFSDSAFACGKVCPYGHCNGWQPTIRQREAWSFLCQDQKQLKESRKDKEMLTEAFKQLSALEGISMVDTTSSIHISTDIRQLRKVARLCGRNFQTPSDHKTTPEYHKILSHVWSILTTAVAESGITSLTRFGTILGKGGNSLCVPLDIRFSDAKIDRLKNGFKNMEKFRAQLTVRTPRSASSGQLGPISKARVQKFASTMPALQNLSLDFDSEPTDNAIFATFTKQLDLSKLTKLQLNTLATDRKSLMAVFERLDSIQELFMTFVDLSRGSWIPVLKQLQGMTNRLDHLHLMYLSEAMRKAYFLAQPDEDEQMGPEDMFDEFMGAPEDEFDEDEDTDEELPPLETMDGEIVDGGANPSPSTASLHAPVEGDNEPPTLPSSSTHQADTAATPASPFSPTSTAQPADSKAPKPGSPGHYSNPEHKAPGQESYPERGYYVCLRGKEEINKQLTKFCLEYNIGDEIGAGVPPMMGGVMGGGVMGGGVMGGMTIPVPANGPPGQPPNVNNILNGLAGYFGLPPMPGQNGGAGGGGGAGQGGAQAGGANTNNANANANGSAAGGQQSTVNTTNQANTSQTNNAQAAAGAAAGPAHGPQLPPHMAGMIPADLADFIMGGPPPTGAAGMGHGGTLDDGWDTDSEFASESDQ